MTMMMVVVMSKRTTYLYTKYEYVVFVCGLNVVICGE